jgi:DNA primase
MAERSEIDRVRELTDLVDLIGSHVTLQSKGREHVGLCPFHDDQTPSMAVVTHKAQAFYNCFSCGASGDAFDFLQNYLKMSFGEALTFLAERAGVTLSTASNSQADAQQRELRDFVRKANDRATAFFRKTLTADAGKAAREMIAARGISADMVETFQLGAAPAGWDGLTRSLPNNATAYDAFTAAGLLKARTEGNGHYDSFRNRLIFPICNQAGQPVAFGGRVLDKDDEPKYLNSPETEVFHKGRTLYGLHIARQAIMESRKVIVTEGYTDVIACHQVGCTNVVGTLGTALTDDHARILSRLCDTVVLLFDGDEAGQRAADRALEVVLKHPVDVQICILPGGTDPADLLAQPDGLKTFNEVVSCSTDVLEYVLQRFEQVLDGQKGLSGRQAIIEGFLGELHRLGLASVHGVRRALLLGKLAELLSLPLPNVESMLTGMARPSSPSTTEAKYNDVLLLPDEDATSLPEHRRKAEQHYLALLIHDPSLHEGHELHAIENFIDPTYRQLAELLLPKLHNGERPTVQDLLDNLRDSPLAPHASHLWFVGQKIVEQGDIEIPPFQDATEALHLSIDQNRSDVRRMTWNAEPTHDATEVASRIEQLRKRGSKISAIHRETGH